MPFHVLFLCTGNSARSILAEALLNSLGGGRWRGYSAGSHPRGEVHPVALEVLKERGHPTDGLRSKSWDEFAAPSAPPMDLVLTVCDAAAGEACPVWPGGPLSAHWGMEDPAAAGGTADERLSAFRRACAELQGRIEMLTDLDPESLEPEILRARLVEIGTAAARHRNGI